ncbi:Tigger transposable element-derived protein 4 [Araneus ventricosus]|uniref:Tigger transposable element-derived protein 4 n=1 Tax=Araneus ventricosus TaxID=182803 RepID=A0A4Y2MNB7_ARAVE|nr:Tigger transposable element-derived protein 4 [Araneus ventricosus]
MLAKKLRTDHQQWRWSPPDPPPAGFPDRRARPGAAIQFRANEVCSLLQLTHFSVRVQSVLSCPTSAQRAHKAQDLANLLGDSDFKTIDGWLSRWKDRNNIVYRKLHGEKQYADSASAEDWRKNVWPTLIKDYKPDQIFNTDETGLFFRALPEHILLFKNESTGGSKKVKERLTVLPGPAGGRCDRTRPRAF